MNVPTDTTPATRPLPQTEPADPRREVREVAEAVALDCRVNPEEYLDEGRVLGGGE